MLRMATVSVVVLTMGDRPEALATAIASARRQRDVDVEIVLVVNGGDPDRTLADVVVEPGENLGIPGGRNAGSAAASGELLCFLDDDGELLGDAVLAGAVSMLGADPDAAVVGFRIVDEHGGSSRRHHPALRPDVDRSGPVTSFPGGACVVHADAFRAVGGLCAPFFYGLEETDLAWRLIDAGFRVHYAADLRMRHPRTEATRHPDFHRRTARNRVWLAHRNLPLVLAVLYVANWTLVTIGRDIGNRAAIAAHLAGTRDGWRTRVGPRAPMSPATAWRLTRLGRPPVI